MIKTDRNYHVTSYLIFFAIEVTSRGKYLKYFFVFRSSSTSSILFRYTQTTSISRNFGRWKTIAINKVTTKYFIKLSLRDLALFIFWLCLIGYWIAINLSWDMATVRNMDCVTIICTNGWITFGYNKLNHRSDVIMWSNIS